MKELLARFLQEKDGFFVGQLTDDELEAFEEAIKRGMAMRSYEGGAGLLGLAKVRPIYRIA